MAKKQQPRFQNSGTVGTSSFDKNLQEDIRDFHLQPNSWTQARNAINNSLSGDLGGLGNEPSNEHCASAPYIIIGAIHIEGDQWAIFSTNNIDSEIGSFVESSCEYTRIVNDRCLAFHTNHLIKGESRELFDCTWQLYWADGNNSDRSMNMQNVPWIQNITSSPGADCITYEDTTALNCDKILLAPLVRNPCFRVEKGATGGTLLNGSYFVVGAYMINEQRVTDYSTPSNVQSIFEHSNSTGSLDIYIEDLDETYDEFELVVVSIINQTTSARRIGIYSTRQQKVSLDIIDNRLTSVGLDLISLRTPIVDKSDAIFNINDYLLRVGPTDKFDFNYQPLANQIESRWSSVEYPADYYRKGGHNPGHMRDEVYAYFIRWVWTTGDKTASYHIPGIYADPAGPQFDVIPTGDGQIDTDDGITAYRWRVYNSATVTSLASTTLPDGGVEIAEGRMGYWESSERYDDDQPDIWDANVIGQPGWDLCGKHIRHHRFPDNYTASSGADIRTNHFRPGSEGSHIRIMGVKFLNIQPPVDNDGNPILNIQGYEILRGSREGNKTVIAKGIINNMREYDLPASISPRQGLYPNYPYNDLRPDNFLASVQSDGVCGPNTVSENARLVDYSRKHFTFHSPETQFNDPQLNMEELKIYGQVSGNVDGQFVLPEKHPKHKFLRDMAFIVSIIGGIGAAMIAKNGKRQVNRIPPQLINLGQKSWSTGYTTGFGYTPAGGAAVAIYPTGILTNTTLNLALDGTDALADGIYDSGALIGTNILLGGTNDLYYSTLTAGWGALGSNPGTMGQQQQYNQELGPAHESGSFLAALQSIPTFTYYFTDAADAIIRLILATSKYRQHALQYQSHCGYDQFRNPTIGNQRKGLDESIYLSPHLHDFGTGHRINNLQRGTAVALSVDYDIADAVGDNSRNTLGEVSVNGWGPDHKNPEVPFDNSNAASHYAALKQRIINQYGQLASIIQIPTDGCIWDISQTTSPIIFGGDIYIGRHTEKNTFFYFYDWLFAQPDGAAMDYREKNMVAYPMFWAEAFDNYDMNTFSASVISAPLSPGSWNFPSDLRVFDRDPVDCFLLFSFIIKNSYFYLFNSGVRDFFVESEINVDYRDWDDTDTGRHYDPYGYSDINALFDMSIIRATNLYKYDYSLSVSKIYNNFVKWGNVQSRDYDPNVAEQCYTYRQDRVLYSLLQHEELKKDNWRVFLPNNYKDFKSRVTAVNSVNKNGAMFLFENMAPVQYMGVDQLQTDTGTKITIGDGGLFSQPQQNLINADSPYEYGSCQNRLSVINTPAGIFWMSQNQGKIFQIQQGIKEISMKDVKWWLAEFMPYKLVDDFPNFELTDNPVDGIGCQSIYSNKNQIVYFCKKDYVLRDDITGVITYVSGNDFLLNGRTPIKLGDPRYFRSASWTLSYDTKAESWIGYHDWHPNLVLPGNNTFMSIMNEGIWLHNNRCDSYCNFYGTDYPFEVEYTVNTIQQVNTLRSIEYQLECYIYAQNCYDRFHDLDFNFDEAVIYNTEQCSGLLRMTLSPKHNAVELIRYPIINPTYIDILFSKEEQKYRFNQFWDITQDRGEFNPIAQRMIFNTEANGYIRNLNPNNLNYIKAQTQRKKFRHYTNTVLLRRRVSGNRKMLITLSNNKNLMSPR